MHDIELVRPETSADDASWMLPAIPVVVDMSIDSPSMGFRGLQAPCSMKCHTL